MCTSFGTCEVTPCKTCSDCIVAVQSYTQAAAAGNNTISTNVAAAFNQFCAANSNSFNASTCASVAAVVSKQHYGNIGKRAGAMCTLLGRFSEMLLTVWIDLVP